MWKGWKGAIWLRLTTSSYFFSLCYQTCISEMLWPSGSCVCAFLVEVSQFSMAFWAVSYDSSSLFWKMTLEVNSAPVSCLSCLCRTPTGLGKDIFLEVSLKTNSHTCSKSQGFRLGKWEGWIGRFPEYLDRLGDFSLTRQAQLHEKLMLPGSPGTSRPCLVCWLQCSATQWVWSVQSLSLFQLTRTCYL